MYYSHTCPYCGKVFYTYNEDKELAARAIYEGIKGHEKEYDEEKKDFTFTHGEEYDTDQIYEELEESDDTPSGGYQV